jgi:hypothetical protein
MHALIVVTLIPHYVTYLVKRAITDILSQLKECNTDFFLIYHN